MNDKNPMNKEVLERVSVQTGFTENNLKRTYSANQNGKDKTKIVRVMIVGSLCTENNITDEELDFAIDIIKKARALNGR